MDSSSNHTDLIVVYGGQWGSEGKGDVVAAITRQRMIDGRSARGATYAVRVGGPNAGHTILDAKGEERKVQGIPVSGLIDPSVVPVLGANAVIDPEILAREMLWRHNTLSGVYPPLVVDRLATTILPEHHQREIELKGRIASTGEGVGAATADKVMRVGIPLEEAIQMADRDSSLYPSATNNALVWLGAQLERGRLLFSDTVRLLSRELYTPTRPMTVIIEGTQGYQLSLNTSGNYPYVTSRDCGPEALMSQVGVNPRQFTTSELIAVFRTHPIRVGGNSGPLPNELTWEQLREATGGYVAVPEQTTVTKKNRRIGKWDDRTAIQTIMETSPTSLAFTFLDYIDPRSCNAGSYEEMARLAPDALSWVEATEERLGIRSSWVSTAAHNCFPRN